MCLPLFIFHLLYLILSCVLFKILQTVGLVIQIHRYHLRLLILSYSKDQPQPASVFEERFMKLVWYNVNTI